MTTSPEEEDIFKPLFHDFDKNHFVYAMLPYKVHLSFSDLLLEKSIRVLDLLPYGNIDDHTFRLTPIFAVV